MNVQNEHSVYFQMVMQSPAESDQGGQTPTELFTDALSIRNQLNATPLPGGSMSVTPTQKEIVRSTFAQVVDDSGSFAALFYKRLFEVDPTLRPMFKGNMYEQGKKLMQILSVAVSSLNNLDTLAPAVHALGARHVKYGVTKEHYAIVGGALVWTLEHFLKAEFTPEVQDAWVAVYTLLAEEATRDAYPIPSMN